MVNILPYRDILPKIGKGVFVAPTASVIGDVEIGEGSSIWFGCTLRGDVHEIRIGRRTNIQDGSVIHTTRKVSGTYIGDDVTVGHMALLHACRIGSRAFIGMGAVVMDQAVVEDEAMVAAGALLTPGKHVPSGQLWGGSPARYMRDITPEELAFFTVSANNYVELAREYL
ncbi:MAG: gamma carbonic anhydrase family protein [Rhodospirillales bacterium]|nr:gamma carbonic anhydrase family protein [Alphaproteobacteria bacterium]USO03442.1 MAG: gamma carbonic anhydrase family protein [Rhodospirillales bacterium]